MARKIQVFLQDDTDGSDASETVTFALDGIGYEIDLNDKNAAKLRSALEPFTSKARRTGRRKPTASPSGSAKTHSAQLSAMREWARKNGHTVSDRGRISREIQDAYSAALSFS